jgi:hypothetical protein
MTQPEPSPLVLSWLPTEEDQVEALRARGMSRRTITRLALASALLVVGAVLGLVSGEPSLVVVGLTGPIVAAYYIGPGRRRIIRRVWRRMPALRGRREVTLVPGEGMTVVSPGFTGHYAWWIFDAVVETDRVFVVEFAGRGGTAYVLLPKRALSSGTDDSPLRDLLAREVVTRAARDAPAH